MKTKRDLIELLEEEYGMDAITLLGETLGDGCCPSICQECGAMYEYEPDCTQGYCEECNSKTVISLQMLVF